MQIKLPWNITKTVGVDVGTDKIKFAVSVNNQIEKLFWVETDQTIHNANREIVEPEKLGMLIFQTLKLYKINPKSRINTAITSSEISHRIIEVATELNLASDELKEYINAEISVYNPWGEEKIKAAYQTLGNIFKNEEEKTQVYTAVTPESNIEKYQSAFKGLNLKVIEVEIFSVTRTIKNIVQIIPPNHGYIIVGIEYDRTEITIINNGMPIFNRTLSFGAKDILEEIKTANKISSNNNNAELLWEISTQDNTTLSSQILIQKVEDIGNEIRRSIHYFITEETNNIDAIEAIYIYGTGGGIQNIAEMLKGILEINCEIINPINTVRTTNNLELDGIQNLSEFTTAIGLAQRV